MLRPSLEIDGEGSGLSSRIPCQDRMAVGDPMILFARTGVATDVSGQDRVRSTRAAEPRQGDSHPAPVRGGTLLTRTRLFSLELLR